MDIDRFWQIIESSRENAGNDAGAQLIALRQSLETLSPDEVVGFAQHFDACDARAYRWDLWAAAYILRGGCSDDSFMDFRASLICRGRNVFEHAVSNPDSLSALDDAESDLFFEGFQYLPQQVYQAKTGADLPPRITPFPTEPAGDEWEEDAESLKAVCPLLWEKHGWDDT